MDSAYLLDLNSASLPPGKLLKSLPAATQEEFFRLARYVIATRFVPIVWLQLARKRRQAQRDNEGSSEATVHHMAASAAGHKLTAAASSSSSAAATAEHVIKESDDFISLFDAPTISHLVKSGTSQTCKLGEIILHAHEPGHCVVVVLRGEVDFFSSPPSASTSRDKLSVQQHPDPHLAHHLHYMRVKRKGLTSCRWLFRSSGPFVFGGSNCFNAEPVPNYAVCASNHAELLVISRYHLIRCFCTLPTYIGQQLAVKANKLRADNLPVAFPMTEGRLRASPLLRDLPVAAIEHVKKCLVPMVFPKGSILYEKGSIGSSIYFLRRGLLRRVAGVQAATSTAQGEGASSPVAEERSMTLGGGGGADESAQQEVQIFRDGATFGELELFFKEKHKATVSAVTNCDVYVYKYNDFMSLQALMPSAREIITEAAVTLREEELWKHTTATAVADASPAQAAAEPLTHGHPSAKMRPSVVPPLTFDEASTRIPLVQLFATPELWRELRGLWRPRVLPAKQVVVSSADPCDRLILLISGTVKVRYATATNRESYFFPGEIIGYTCLVAHRWAQTLVATTHCDAWEMPREDFAAALRNHKIYHKVLGAAMQLVQPMIVFPHRCPYVSARVLLSMTGSSSNASASGGRGAAAPRNTLENLKTQNMHPVSFSETMTYPPWRPLDENSNLEVFAGKSQWRQSRKEVSGDQNHGKKVVTTASSSTDQTQPNAIGNNFFAARKGTESPSSSRARTPMSTIFSATLDDKEPAPYSVDALGNLESRTVSFPADDTFERAAAAPMGTQANDQQQQRDSVIPDTMQISDEGPTAPLELEQLTQPAEKDLAVDDSRDSDNDEGWVGRMDAVKNETEPKRTSTDILNRLSRVSTPAPPEGYSTAVMNIPTRPVRNNPRTDAAASDAGCDVRMPTGTRPTSARRYLEPPSRQAPPPPPKPRAPLYKANKSWHRAVGDSTGFAATIPRPMSASEKYGSLMRKVFGTAAPEPSRQQSASAAGSYLWGSSSVATPLLACRKENDHLKVLLHRYPAVIPPSWTSVYATSGPSSPGRKGSKKTAQENRQTESPSRPMPKSVREPLNFASPPPK